MGYAFISYSSANQQAADGVRALLTKNGISAWMAPYDIPAGCEYAEVIGDALAGCACLVLILTEKAQTSVWVKKEINLAVSDGKTVIPIKLEDIVLNSSMRLYLNDQQIVSVHELCESSPEMQKVLLAVRACTGTAAEPTKTAQGAPVAEKTPTTPRDVEPVEAVSDPWECYRRGYRYELGEGTPIDHEEAARWYRRGAELGNSWCQHRMGVFALGGFGMPKDEKEAVKWFTLGAEAGDHSSCNGLAECYEKGLGVARDPILASVWRAKARLYEK